MSSKKNLPHIPLYIGDWQKDCDVLSLECEGAWLRIIFKMFTNGKQSVYKIPTKSLQNLWKCGPEKMNEIIDELEFNNICGISRDERFIEFTSRRFIRENNLSEIRKEAVSKRKDRTKPLQKTNKTNTNSVQTPDNDIDIDNNIENKKEKPARKKVVPLNAVKLPFGSERFAASWAEWIDYKQKQHGFRYKSHQYEEKAANTLKTLSGNDEEEAINLIDTSISNGWKGFFPRKNHEKPKTKSKWAK